jgi:LysR family transcriptional activator of nhaA
MSFLNYHHLRYFRAIATEGTLTGAAQRIQISQSALSVQLRSLEDSLGQLLFHRQKKTLVLTEAGRIALEYAESIFRSGEEMMAVLRNEKAVQRRVLRIGAVATLSRNFQLELLKPLLGRDDVELILHSGSLRDLLAQLRAHVIDAVLSNLPVRRDAETNWHSRLIEEQPVSLVGKRTSKRARFQFPEDLRHTPLLLPGLDSSIRAAFDLLQLRADFGMADPAIVEWWGKLQAASPAQRTQMSASAAQEGAGPGEGGDDAPAGGDGDGPRRGRRRRGGRSRRGGRGGSSGA